MNRVARTLLNVMRIEVLLGIGLVMWVISLEATAQTLVEFKNGQVADAEKLNQNFATLAARIQLESGGDPFYTFLGYTEKTFEDFVTETETETPGNSFNPIEVTHILASQHCKYEFGATAFVATTDIIEYLIMTGNSFYLPTNEAIIALGIESSNNYALRRNPFTLTSSGEAYFRDEYQVAAPLACVKITGLP